MRTWLAIVLTLPLALAGCPQFLSDFDVGASPDGGGGSRGSPSPGTGSNPSTGGGTSESGGASAVGGVGANAAGGSAGTGGSMSTGGASVGGSAGSPSGGASGSSGSGSGGSGGLASGGSPSGGAGGSSECSTGAVQCVDAQRQTCIGGIWLDNGAACSGVTPVCLDGSCVTCAPGEKKCVSSMQPQTCGPAGTWQDDTACDGASTACLDGTCASCPISTFLHDNGLGQAFCNTVPSGTLNYQLAVDACAAYAAVNGGGACTSSGCVCYGTGPGCACWNFGGSNIGYVHVDPGTCACSNTVGDDFEYW